MSVEFEWDFEKARLNLVKHGIDFETAANVFSDPFALAEPDLTSRNEERWRTIGLVRGVLLLLVSHTVRDEGDIELIRIISARRTDPSERLRYERARREGSGV
jgi:uncharacterized protein